MDEPISGHWLTTRRFTIDRDALNPAPNAVAAITAHKAVSDCTVGAGYLTVRYDFRQLPLDELLEQLADAGFRLQNSAMQALRLAVWRFTEDRLRQNAGHEYGWDAIVREIYMRHYRYRRHGRRDDRPQHWRQYLNRRQSS